MRFPTEASLSDLSLDKFGHRELAKNLVANVFLEMELPNTFGIYGNWGTGKSTFLQAVQGELTNNADARDILAIRFDPWKYEYADHIDLFTALISDFREQAKIPKTNEVWNDLTSAMLGISTSIFKKLLHKASAGMLDVDDMRAEANLAATAFPEDQFEQADLVQQLRGKLNNLIQVALTENTKKRVCIFIDDLDRCSPEHTVTLLEAIKNFLLTSNVLFVFALDRRIVSEMIEKKYGLHSGYGDEYLTKIIQYSLTLPAPTHEGILSDILADHLIEMPKDTQGWIIRFTNRFANETRKFKQLVYQLITQAKLGGIDLSKDAPLDTTSLFCAIYLKSRFPKLFHVSRKAALENIKTYGSMISAETDNKPEKARDFASQLGISGEERKILTELFIFQMPNNKGLMNENRHKLEEAGFSRMID